ncbi:MAG: Sjogren's syndrome/scleroderma autoantigen 1 family protein [Candidatus Bathyarchaeia archaeon]
MQEKTENGHIKRMADLLRQGATLTDLACPACNSPLFRLKDGTLWCGRDEKRVILVKEGEEPPRATSNAAMETLEATLTAKIQDLQARIQRTDDVDELQKLTSALSELLNSLEKAKRMKKS